MAKILFAGRGYTVSKRVGIIIAWLIEQDERLAALDRVQIVFDCAGEKSVSVEIKHRERVKPAGE